METMEALWNTVKHSKIYTRKQQVLKDTRSTFMQTIQPWWKWIPSHSLCLLLLSQLQIPHNPPTSSPPLHGAPTKTKGMHTYMCPWRKQWILKSSSSTLPMKTARMMSLQTRPCPCICWLTGRPPMLVASLQGSIRSRAATSWPLAVLHNS